jgi:cytidylate kinase
MKTRVICVSRALGAGGEEMGLALSQRMGFRYADEEIVATAAEREGVDVELVQDAERRQTFIERVLKSFAVAPASEVMAISPGSLHPAAFLTSEEMTGVRAALRGTEYFRELIRAVVRDTAREGNVVIVAHAAAMALAGEEGVLRVFVTASPEIRAGRIAAARGIGAEEAARAIKDSDKSRRDYLKTFYGASEELPVHYDIVVNTDVLTLEQAVEAILAAAEQ